MSIDETGLGNKPKQRRASSDQEGEGSGSNAAPPVSDSEQGQLVPWVKLH